MLVKPMKWFLKQWFEKTIKGNNDIIINYGIKLVAMDS
jgi:hypothetical protein